MTAYHAGRTQYSTALKICNQSKNRSADLLPTDSHRVFLSPLSENEGADYINASWLTGEDTDLLSVIQSEHSFWCRFLQPQRLHPITTPAGQHHLRYVAACG